MGNLTSIPERSHGDDYPSSDPITLNQKISCQNANTHHCIFVGLCVAVSDVLLTLFLLLQYLTTGELLPFAIASGLSPLIDSSVDTPLVVALLRPSIMQSGEFFVVDIIMSNYLFLGIP